MKRATWLRGTNKPIHHISCIDARSNLITSEFIINQQSVTVIIDTGASASFIPELGDVLKIPSPSCKRTPIYAKTANNSTFAVESSANLWITPPNESSRAKCVQLYIIRDHATLLGYQAIIGLDLCKLFDIQVAKDQDLMCAFIHGSKIGQESRITSMKPAIATVTEDAEDSLELTVGRLIDSYDDIFAETVSGAMKVDPMSINLVNHSLVKARLRRSSPEDIEEIKRQVDRLFDNDIIETANSPYSSNVHLVPKKNGQKRLVVNFIPLNRVTVKDHYPMPQIQDLLMALRGAKCFCALDCTEGFFQIPLRSDHRERTAFITPHGMYQFKRCPFGFTNSPAVFQRSMNSIFKEGLYRKCVIYIDDILVFGASEEDTLKNLEWVFEKCRLFNVKLKKSKCHFMKNCVEFLGHQISLNTIAPIPGKNDFISSIKPRTKSDVLSILGVFNYYSRFIPSYTEKTKELRRLTKKDAEFVWTTNHDGIVQELQQSLEHASAHIIPDTYSPKSVRIYTAPTSVEVACFNANEDLISRASNVLSSSEINYTPAEKNLIGLVLAYEKFGPYLRGQVTVHSNCKQFQTAIHAKEKNDRVNRMLLALPPEADFTIEITPGSRETQILNESQSAPDEVFYTDGACTGNGRPECRASWAVLATLNPQLSKSGLVSCPRPSNQVAELVAIHKACEIAIENDLKDITIITDSKYAVESINKWIDLWIDNGWKDTKGKPVVNEAILKNLDSMRKRLNIRCLHVKGHSADPNNSMADLMARDALEQSFVSCGSIAAPPTFNQRDDPEILKLIENLDSNISLQEKFIMKNGMLCFVDPRLPCFRRNRIYVPSTAREHLLRIAHDDPIYGGHLGVKKTRSKLFGYYWPNMAIDIQAFVNTCTTCQKFKNPKGPKFGLLQPIPASKVFERLHIDIIGPVKESYKGNRYILTAIDAFSRYAYAKALPEVKTADVVDFLREEVISKHGIPEQITSDNGSQFTSAMFKLFITKLQIKQTVTCAYHPQANGMDERFNGSLVKILRNYIDSLQQNWDSRMIWALLVYNTTPNESTGFSPYVILYGAEPRTPLNTLASEGSTDPSTVNHTTIRNLAKQNMDRAHRIQKYYYDKRHKPQDFKLYDLVLLKASSITVGNTRKLAHKWVGPYMITRMIQYTDVPQAVEILNMESMTKRRASFQDLKHFQERKRMGSEESEEEVDEADLPYKITLPGDIILYDPSAGAHIDGYPLRASGPIETNHPQELRVIPPKRTYSRNPANTQPNVQDSTMSYPVFSPPSPSHGRSDQVLAPPSPSHGQSDQVLAPPSPSHGQSDQVLAPSSPSHGQSDQVLAPPSPSHGQSDQVLAPPSPSHGQSDQVLAPSSPSHGQQEQALVPSDPTNEDQTSTDTRTRDNDSQAQRIGNSDNAYSASRLFLDTSLSMHITPPIESNLSSTPKTQRARRPIRRPNRFSPY